MEVTPGMRSQHDIGASNNSMQRKVRCAARRCTGTLTRSERVKMNCKKIASCAVAVLSAALAGACGSSPEDREAPSASLLS